MDYAHSLDGQPDSEWETLEAHSRRVAHAAAGRAAAFDAAPLGAALGLAHDLGKVKPAFQNRLRGRSVRVAHSGEGAHLLSSQGDFGRMLAGIVAGHHGRLPNPDALDARLRDAEAVALPDWLMLEPLAPPPRLLEKGLSRDQRSFRAQFLVRMLYACLTDADDRETAAFFREAVGSVEPPRIAKLTPAMRAAFDRHMAGLGGVGEVNALRRRVLTHVRAQAHLEPGLFTMTVPTGGGKTLASLGFGLDHAAEHGLRRLIYVIPFTSVVEQTADVFRDVFRTDLRQDVVLEHHSAFDWEGLDETEAEQRRVAGASWDAPVVVTTAVQFFESLYAARKKRCRKLHNLARSVIVIDEAQTMPRSFLRPCLAALRELMAGYRTSVVLSTATQPALTREGGFPAPEALENAREIAPDPPALYSDLRRVRVRDIGAADDAALAGRMREAKQALLILDNRMQARRLYESIRGMPGAAHLSTLMTAAHRRAVLGEVRHALKLAAPVRLVSTSLVAAGVDVDFPLVLRAAAGIDSLAQAAGRCNREGRMAELGELLVFRPEHPSPPVVEDYAVKGREVLARYADDALSLDAVAAYFRLLWDAYGSEALDAAEVGETRGRGILAAIADGGMECPFEDIERAFRLIGDDQLALIIRGGRHGVSEPILEELAWQSPGSVARRLQPYTINLPRRLWRGLWQAGAVAWWRSERFDEQFAVLENAALYDDAAGLAVDGFGDLGLLIV